MTAFVHKLARHLRAFYERSNLCIFTCMLPSPFRLPHQTHLHNSPSCRTHLPGCLASLLDTPLYHIKMSHSHSHDHYDGEDPHDHSHGAHDHDDDITPALQNLLYEQIDFSAVTCLNEEEPRSASKVLQKTWMERMEDEPELKSDADEQLLLVVPYVLPLFTVFLLVRVGLEMSRDDRVKSTINHC